MKGFVLAACIAPLLFCTDALANYRADVNRDGTINFLDVAEFSDCFLESTALNPDCASEDINQDGSINFLDLAVLSEFFLSVRPNFSDRQRFGLPTILSVSTFANFADLDSDGDSDMYTSTAYYDEFAQESVSYSGAKINLGPLNFNVTGVVGSTFDAPLAIRRPHDFDGDGLLDLVRKDNFTTWPIVYRQNPDQSFTPFLIQAVGCSGFLLRTSDMDQDGDTEIICNSFFSGEVGVFYADGYDYSSDPGASLGSEPFDLSGGYQDIEILDVNSDGWNDLLVATQSTTANTGLKIYMSDQNGGFVTPTEYFLEAQAIQGITIADFDGDGVKDFAVNSNEPGMQRVHLYIVGATGPVAAPPVSYAELGILATSVSGEFVPVDTNGDGDKELAAMDSDESLGQFLRFYDYDSTDGLVELFSLPMDPGLGTTTPKAGYFNDDIIEDLGFNGNNMVTFVMSEFPNSYKVAERYVAADAAVDVSSLTISNDEFPDLAAVYRDTHSVGIRLNTTGKPIASEIIYDVGGAPSEILVADLNQDDKQDIVVVTNDNTSVSVLIANGTGGFLPYEEFPAGQDNKQFELVDIDNNGTLDLHAGNNLLLGNGIGGFDAPIFLAGASNWNAYRFAYINEDSFPDVVYITTPSPLRIRLTNNDCVFCGNTVELSVPGTFPLLASIAVDDLDNDLDLDIVVSGQAESQFGGYINGKVAIYTNEGSNVFTEAPVSTIPANDRVETSIRDIDGDGWNDIVTGALTVLFSDEGDFSSTPIVFNASSANNYALVDLDLDDLIDLVYVTDDGHYIRSNR